MNTIKAVVDFTRYSNVDLGPVAERIHTKMADNAATFGDPPVSMTELGTLVQTYKEKLVARSSRATADVLALNVAREELEEALGELGHYVNVKAKGSAAIVELSGFPSYERTRTADTSPPGAPTNVRVLHGRLSGTVLVRYRSERLPGANEVQTTGDPNVEADWKTAGIFLGQKALLEGLKPGTVIWVRVRTAGLKGVMGAWSDPAQIMVL